MVTVLRPVLVTAVIYRSYPRNNDCVAAAARGDYPGKVAQLGGFDPCASDQTTCLNAIVDGGRGEPLAGITVCDIGSSESPHRR